MVTKKTDSVVNGVHAKKNQNFVHRFQIVKNVVILVMSWMGTIVKLVDVNKKEVALAW